MAVFNVLYQLNTLSSFVTAFIAAELVPDASSTGTDVPLVRVISRVAFFYVFIQQVPLGRFVNFAFFTELVQFTNSVGRIIPLM